MKVGKETYCDICHLVIAPYDPRRLDYGRTQYHGECHSRRYYRMAQAAAAHFIVLVLVFLAVPVHADEPGDVRGCYAQYNTMNGQFVYEPFLKVSDKDSPSEYGLAEVWGFRPWNLLPPDKEGKTHPVNILEGQFIPIGKNKEVLMYRDNPDKKKSARCPEHLWQ
jgi:hypothetical protein